MTGKQQRRAEIAAVIDHWAEVYNDRIEELASLYTSDCRVDVKNGIKFQGIESFTTIEVGVEKASRGRKLTVERLYIDGDTAIVLASVRFPHLGENASPSHMCAILTFDGDKIAVDESYMDLRYWPTPDFTGKEWAELLD